MAASLRRIGLVVAQRIAGDLPTVDRDLIETVVGRTLNLLARAAGQTNFTLYLMAQILDNPTFAATRSRVDDRSGMSAVPGRNTDSSDLID